MTHTHQRDSSAPEATNSPLQALPTMTFMALALLSATPALSTDLCLAAYPQIRTSLATDAASVQLTMTAFLIGVGVGQVVWGPVSDRYGRRLPLLLGCGVATLAAVVATFAPTIEVLIAARLLQAVAISAGIVIARAIVSDRLARALPVRD